MTFRLQVHAPVSWSQPSLDRIPLMSHWHSENLEGNIKTLSLNLKGGAKKWSIMWKKVFEFTHPGSRQDFQVWSSKIHSDICRTSAHQRMSCSGTALLLCPPPHLSYHHRAHHQLCLQAHNHRLEKKNNISEWLVTSAFDYIRLQISGSLISRAGSS